MQLIQMRDRIRAIETIHKITHAMRLISMSHHARLKSREDALRQYGNELNTLFLKVKSQAPAWSEPRLYPSQTTPSQTTGKELVIIMSSQKGLCGSFNSLLFKFIGHELSHSRSGGSSAGYDVIALGKRVIEYVQSHHAGPIVYSVPAVSLSQLPTYCHEITEHIKRTPEQYSRILFVANNPKSFFTQVPQIYVLVPFLHEEETTMETLGMIMQDYEWEQSAQEILSALVWQCFQGTIHNLMFRSLLAEHAARFLSMDGATRNAKTLLESTRLQYNKVRQAKITREIIELSEIV